MTDTERSANQLARRLADAIDERDAARANYDTVRDDLEEKSRQYDQATTWLALIAEPGCETWTTGPGSCTRDVGRYTVARYGTAYQWCDPCRAWAALNDVPMTTQPEWEGP